MVERGRVSGWEGGREEEGEWGRRGGGRGNGWKEGTDKVSREGRRMG